MWVFVCLCFGFETGSCIFSLDFRVPNPSILTFSAKVRDLYHCARENNVFQYEKVLSHNKQQLENYDNQLGSGGACLYSQNSGGRDRWVSVNLKSFSLQSESWDNQGYTEKRLKHCHKKKITRTKKCIQNFFSAWQSIFTLVHFLIL